MSELTYTGTEDFGMPPSVMANFGSGSGPGGKPYGGTENMRADGTFTKPVIGSIPTGTTSDSRPAKVMKFTPDAV